MHRLHVRACRRARRLARSHRVVPHRLLRRVEVELILEPDDAHDDVAAATVMHRPCDGRAGSADKHRSRDDRNA